MKQAAKPYRNQRVSRPRQRRQQHLLEVSIRASKAREQRVRRVLGTMFKVLALSILMAGLWVGSKEAFRNFFWDNPTFHLTDVRIQTDADGTLTREQIIQAGGIRESENIMLTDLAGARAALDKLPQVDRVEIHRSLPNRLDIIIQERRPIAWIVAPGDVDPSASERSFLVDARGYIMRTRKIRPEYHHLPHILGVETGNLVPGQKVLTVEVQSALELLRLNADSTRWQVRTVDVSKGYCLVVTDRSRAEVTFGLDNIDSQIARLYRLLDHLQRPENQLYGTLRTVNLFVERNTPATFEPPPPAEEAAAELEEGADPEETADAAKPSSTTAKPSSSGSRSRASSSPTPNVRKAQPVTRKTSSKAKPSPTPRKTPVDRLKKPFRANG